MIVKYKAIPMSNADIRVLAQEFRKILGVGQQTKIDIIRVLEFALPSYFGINYNIRQEHEMEMDAHAYCDPETKDISIREDIYLRAVDGQGRDRLTIAHEISHALFHGKRFLTRVYPGEKVKTFEDQEWQANAFAGELLCPAEATRGLEIYEIVEKFCVSESCASTQKRKGDK